MEPPVELEPALRVPDKRTGNLSNSAPQLLGYNRFAGVVPCTWNPVLGQIDHPRLISRMWTAPYDSSMTITLRH
jgi:hypothetical protein